MAIPLNHKPNLNKRTNELRRLIRLGIQKGLWKTVLECGKAIGHPNSQTLQNHTYEDFNAKHLEQDFQLLGNFLTDQGIKFTCEYYEPPNTDNRVTEHQGVGPPLPNPESSTDMTRVIVLLESINELLSKGDATKGTVGGLFFDLLLSGVVGFNDQVMEGMRFVLTEGSFRKLDGVIGDREIDDTRRLIAELRRRFGIFSQLDAKKHDAQRQKLAQALKSEVDQLFVAITQSRKVIPSGAAAYLQDLESAAKAPK